MTKLTEGLKSLAAQAAREDIHCIACLLRNQAGSRATEVSPVAHVFEDTVGTRLGVLLEGLLQIALVGQELPGTVVEQRVFTSVLELLSLHHNVMHMTGLEQKQDGKWRWIE